MIFEQKKTSFLKRRFYYKRYDLLKLVMDFDFSHCNLKNKKPTNHSLVHTLISSIGTLSRDII
jgi:hypothetical protein